MNGLFQNIGADIEKDRKKVFRLLPILAMLLAFCLFNHRVYAQSFNPLISFSVESCSLDVALEKLFADYELNVAFSKAELSKIRIEGYSCSYKSVEEVLTDLLKGTDYGFKRVGKQYVIRKNQMPEPVADEEIADIQPVVKPKEKEKEEHKIDTVIVSTRTSDTIRIYDTVQIIRSVMRHDTVVEVRHKVQTDTVYVVKYKGLEIHWPKFRDNGWFITPLVTLGAARFRHENGLPELENGSVEITPNLAYGIGLDGGYKKNRFSVGMNVSYRSVSYRFLLEKTDFSGDYYVNDTLDTYYVVHPAGDTTYHYIMDSTYIPLTTTNYAYRDVNRLDYLNIGLFAAFDFVRLEHFRAFAKVGASVDILIQGNGSLNASERPYHAPIAKEQVESVKVSYFGGLGVAFKVVNRLELVPEVQYGITAGSLYRAGFPFDMKMRMWDFRLGLTYYF